MKEPGQKSRAVARTGFVRVIFALCIVVFPGCASERYSVETAPEYSIIREFTPFYRLGPQQGRPDASLTVDTRVKLLSREMGFSLVQLEDNRTGYVANENMAPAPPRPKRREEPSETGSARRSSRSSSGPLYSGPPLNDIPLPDPNVPPPDLNIEPEIMPDTIPMPAATPAGTPRFRY